MACTYLHTRKGTYYFRMGLPPAIQRACGQREWLYSLDTKDYREGRRRCLTLSKLAHDLLMKIDHLIKTQATIAPEQVREVVRGYFSEALARLKTHVANVHDALPYAEYIAANDAAKLAHAADLIKQPLFYLPDSMAGVLGRNEKGEVIKSALKLRNIPMAMQPVGMEDIVAHVVQRNNLPITPANPAYQSLQHGIKQAVSQLQTLHEQYAQHNPSPEITDYLFKDLENATPSKLFSEVYTAYLMDIEQGLEPLTIARKKKAYVWFVEKFGDIPIQTITKKHHAIQFKDMLTNIPAHGSKRHKGKTVNALESATGSKLGFNSQRIYLSAMKALFTWAIDKAGHYEGENPFGKVSPPSPKKAKQADKTAGPYEADTLKAIFNSPIYTGHMVQRTKAGTRMIKDSLYWVPLMALFTGARREEICQLHTKDIRQEGETWIIDINTKDSDKHLKNDQSARLVPIHDQLIKLGLLDYAATQKAKKEKLLFPDITYSKGKQRYGDMLGRTYSRALTQLKIKAKGTNFHSFRHTMIDALRGAEIEEGVIMALVGHKDTRMIGNYGKGYRVEVLKTAIDKVSFPMVDWTAVGKVKSLPTKPTQS